LASGASTTLTDGIEVPRLGFGVWQIPDGAETERAVSAALEAGYRHVDTAQDYGNEAGVGRAVAGSGLPRDEVFVTTKYHPAGGDPVAELERSLDRLGMDRVDLYLVHWPRGDPLAPWPAMERALERGLTRAIGVSNYGADDLEAVVASASSAPVVNQIELNPFHHRRALVAACERLGVTCEAYSPLTRGADFGNPVIAEIAGRTGRTPAQVMLRWGFEHGFIVITKSVRRERIAENAAVFDFSLPPEDVAALDRLDRTRGTGRATERWWHEPRSLPRRLSRRLGLHFPRR
jgi:diketogulonate reductase-like aldo/keto reductase